MKKNLLALSIAAMVGGIAGGANAQVTSSTTGIGGGRIGFSNQAFGTLAAAATPANRLAINEDGQGHILFVPYFTTQGDNASLLNIVNTDTVNGKAVKLRYRGASNSDDLFDITIYLSPGDVWTANVANEGGLSRLITDDKSCTLPSAADIKAAGGKFKTDRVRNNAAVETREGYIEILNMADIPVRSVDPSDATKTVANPLFTAIKHVNGVAPCTQAVMDAQENALGDPGVRGYTWPTGGLFANWTIVNVADKASFSGEAVAVQAERFVPATATTAEVRVRNAQANLVWSPQTTASIAADVAALLTADPLLAQGAVRAASYDFPDLSTPYTVGNTNVAFGEAAAAQASQLATALQNASVSNEFLTNPAVSFATDWVFSMPTRRYAVALDYTTNSIVANTGLFKELNAAGLLVDVRKHPGVQQHFVAGSNGNAFLNAARDRICVSTIGLRALDREESTKTTFVISPDSAVNLCGEVSVLSFNSADYSVLGASLARVNIQTQYLDGWFRVGTPGATNNGLPVIGFAAAKARGANLGGTWAHRYN